MDQIPIFPSLGFVRALLAAAVIYYHSFALCGHLDFFGEKTDLGQIGVDNFFFLSGFLLVRKSISSDFQSFMYRRLNRLLPGLFIFLTFCIIGMVILDELHVFHVGLRDLFSWFYTNLDPVNPNRMFGINGAFTNNPVPQTIAGNLYTITFEFWCYLVLAGTVATLKNLILSSWILATFQEFWL